MSPRIHPDIDPPDPAVRVGADALHAEDNCMVHANDYGKPGHECEYCVGTAQAVLEAARPIWAAQLAVAVEDAAEPPNVHFSSREWYAVAEFIRAREERP